MTDLVRHHEVQGLSDRIALGFTKFLRFLADTFFCRMRDDDGWIGELLEEAENERMHLMAFVALFKPNWFERFLVLMAQGAFWNAYFLLYLFAPRTAHRAIGYFEEEAIISYTEFLKEIDAGNVANVAAPKLAIDYWKMAPDARLRDLVIAVRDDEARHRDVNHDFAARLDQTKAQGAQIGEGDAMLAENREQNRPAA